AQALPQRAKERVREARADAPGVAQRVAVVGGQVKRAEGPARAPSAGALSLRKPDDHEVAGSVAADLEPARTAPPDVRRVGALGHDALEAEPGDLGEERLAFALEVVGEAHGAEARHDASEERLADREREGPEVVTLPAEEIEGVEDGGVGDGRA